MRPPRSAAENLDSHTDDAALRARFNEAAAFCGGKYGKRLLVPGAPDRFNEAAAFCGGKLQNHRRARRRFGASMRPPRSAAENRTSASICTTASWSFNEAAAFCGGKYAFGYAGTVVFCTLQ